MLYHYQTVTVSSESFDDLQKTRHIISMKPSSRLIYQKEGRFVPNSYLGNVLGQFQALRLSS